MSQLCWLCWHGGAESISGTRIMLAAFEKDLSFMPERPLGKVHFVSMQIERVRMGRGAEHVKLRAMSNGGRSAGGHKGRQLVYRVTSGAPFGTYVVLCAPSLRRWAWSGITSSGSSSEKP